MSSLLAGIRILVRKKPWPLCAKITGIHFTHIEERYNLEPAHRLTPDKIFERRWALTLLDQVLGRLRDEFASAGKADHFDRLKIFLAFEKSELLYVSK